MVYILNELKHLFNETHEMGVSPLDVHRMSENSLPTEHNRFHIDEKRIDFAILMKMQA